MYLLNLSYENAFFQQIANFISANENMFEVFFNELTEKIFMGRNVNISIKDMKFMFRYIISIKHILPIDIMIHLASRLKTKASNGARTIHQNNQAAMLMSYIMEVLESKERIKELFEDKEKINELYQEILSSIEEQVKDTENEEGLKKKKGILSEIRKMVNKLDNFAEKMNKNKINGQIKVIQDTMKKIFEEKINVK